jgi:Mn-dependent DtxR family transcriptional regulator
MVAANLANLEQGGDHQSEKRKVQKCTLVKITDEDSLIKPPSIKAAAEKLKVSPDTVKRAMVAADLANLEQGRPEKVLIKTLKSKVVIKTLVKIKDAAKKLKAAPDSVKRANWRLKSRHPK